MLLIVCTWYTLVAIHGTFLHDEWQCIMKLYTHQTVTEMRCAAQQL